jgi:hypothetical protein
MSNPEGTLKQLRGISEDNEVSIHCLFAIVNVGETIDEGLASASPEVRARIDAYQRNRHVDHDYSE